jgi:acyl transferase domain-containing protein
VALLLLEGVKLAGFASAKSKYGHAETAAGVLGLWHAANRLQNGIAQVLPHLRSPNPHVMGVLNSQKSEIKVALARGSGPSVCSSMQAAPLLGVSSFAFQVSFLLHHMSFCA